MIPLVKIGRVIKEAGRLTKYLATTQNRERENLQATLTEICGRVDDSLTATQKALQDIKENFADPGKTEIAVREFIRNDELAERFKPEHLCGDLADFLTRLKSNLSPLKFSIAITKIAYLEYELGELNQLDIDLRAQYSCLIHELSDLCDDYALGKSELSAELIRDAIVDFEEAVDETLSNIRTTRAKIVSTV